MLKTSAIGTLGKDAILKTIGEKQYSSFSIAISEKTKSGDTRTTWINILKADESGKLTPYLMKGTKVYISGKPTLSAYVSKKTDEAVADMTIWANELEFCASAKKDDQDHCSDTHTAPPPPDDDGLPF